MKINSITKKEKNKKTLGYIKNCLEKLFLNPEVAVEKTGNCKKQVKKLNRFFTVSLAMKTLELFAGTQSFTKGVKHLYSDAECITVDILPKFSPTVVADILQFDYQQYQEGQFDIIWCSPPCTEYSKAKTRGERNLTLADSLVRKCFEIIDYLKPKVWIVENVGTGLLVNRMETIRPHLSKVFVDYCCYGKPYRKRTVLWCNQPLAFQLCQGKGKCSQMDGSKHKGSCGNGTSKYNSVGINSVWTKDEIPQPLILSLLTQLQL